MTRSRPPRLLVLFVLAVIALSALGAWAELSRQLFWPAPFLEGSDLVSASSPTTPPWDPSGARPLWFDSELARPARSDVATLPPQHPFDADRYLGRPLFEVPNDKNEVALTFDDGPSPQTRELLGILAREHVGATFFFVGERASSLVGRQIVRDTLAAGNDVGNHTWTHVDLKNLSPDALAQEIDLAQALFFADDGRAPSFLRPRGGKFDAAAVDAATQRGLILTLWSTDAHDIDPSPLPAIIAHDATRGVHSGSIIDLHDRNPDTVRALPDVLRELRRRGLRPVTLSQLLADGTP